MNHQLHYSMQPWVMNWHRHWKKPGCHLLAPEEDSVGLKVAREWHCRWTSVGEGLSWVTECCEWDLAFLNTLGRKIKVDLPV